MRPSNNLRCAPARFGCITGLLVLSSPGGAQPATPGQGTRPTESPCRPHASRLRGRRSRNQLKANLPFGITDARA